MSLGSVLGTARSALKAQQLVIDTTGHNISNAQTAGYTRQHVELVPGMAQSYTYGTVGSGVDVADIRRTRDVLLDAEVRQQSGGESAATQRQALLGAVEQVLGEPSDTGLAATLDAYWSSWSDLAAQPTNGAAKAVIAQRGTAVATMLNTFDQRLADLRTQTTTALDNSLVEVNGLARQVADLNGRIVADETSGHQANDLRDARDKAVDRLAALGGTTSITRTNGSMQVLFGTYTLVDGTSARQLQRTQDVDGTAALAFVDQPDHALTPMGGSTQAMVEVLNGGLQDMQDRLDSIANMLAKSVNAVMATRVDAAGKPTDPFFVDRRDGTFVASADPFTKPAGPGTVTASSIRVRAGLTTDASGIPSSSDAKQPADNDVALAIAGFRTGATSTLGGVQVQFDRPDRSRLPVTTGGVTTPVRAASAGTMTFADFYASTVTGLGVQVGAANDDAAVHATLADQARTRRDSITGVNVDEELTTLMQAQQAYAAAAKIVTTVDEMMKTLLQMV